MTINIAFIVKICNCFLLLIKYVKEKNQFGKQFGLDASPSALGASILIGWKISERPNASILLVDERGWIFSPPRV
jgi:hypothetical protein